MVRSSEDDIQKQGQGNQTINIKVLFPSKALSGKADFDLDMSKQLFSSFHFELTSGKRVYRKDRNN